MRLFLAVTPEPRALDALADLVRHLRVGLGDDPGLRWVDVEHQHLTLHFLGEIDSARVDALIGALDGPLQELPFEIAFGQLGIFPPAGLPRVIWMGVDRGRTELARVHAELGARLLQAGVSAEQRPFTPHLTLARVRGGRRPSRGLRQQLAALPAPTAIVSGIDRVTLFESDLSGPRPRYRIATELPLRGGGGRGQILN
jgi:2'-5' RNA ligase